jgi:tetratricopeptide (TPR) repeat protein
VTTQGGGCTVHGAVCLFLLFCLLSVAAIGCSTQEAARRSKLLPVTLPDLSRVDEAVQLQARERYATLTRMLANRDTAAADLTRAYGDFGMLMQAAEYYEAAEPCYLNAQALAPEEPRWPYYLGHLRKSQGETDKAEAAFKRVLELRPDDLPALVWLGRLNLDKGRPEEAEPLFARARTLMPRSVAALAGLGRAALAKRDYAGAASHLEEALSIDPQAESLHAPLAMAYRGLGDVRKAEPHLKQWRNTDILLPDPLQQELDLLLESGLSYELRGVRALESKDWKAAAGFFRRGIELAPQNTPLRRSLQHKLGTALFMTGDVNGAEQQFEAVVRESPGEGVDESTAKAHYSLAVLRASSGRSQDAIEHFSAAVTYQPNYVEAQLALAEALRRAGRAEASLAPYRKAIDINPRASQARLGYAFALARLGRYREARDWLAEAVVLAPDRPELSHALARLLVAAPDDRVRDGQRAMIIVQQLLKGQKTTDLGETMAMTLAELGDFDEAAAIQRGVMSAARDAGLAGAVRRMTENLRLYEHHQPCRTPWRDEEVAGVLPSPVSDPTLAASPPSR